MFGPVDPRYLLQFRATLSEIEVFNHAQRMRKEGEGDDSTTKAFIKTMGPNIKNIGLSYHRLQYDKFSKSRNSGLTSHFFIVAIGVCTIACNTEDGLCEST